MCYLSYMVFYDQKEVGQIQPLFPMACNLGKSYWLEQDFLELPML